MVTVPCILSPAIKPAVIRYDLFLSDGEIRAQIERGFDEIVELIQLLASVTTRRELEKELGRRTQEYLHLTNETWHAIVKMLPQHELVNFVLETYDEISRIISADTSVLGIEERELLLNLIDRLRDLFETVVDGLSVQQLIFTDTLLECSSSLQRVDMCLFSIILVLDGKIKRWNLASIKLLSHAASDYMLEVEDIFLMHDAELAERLRTRSEGVSLDEVKRDIGLPS